MGDLNFLPRFFDARRPGLYVRVLEPGAIEAGDPVAYQPASADHPRVNDLFALCVVKERDPELVRRCLQAPVSERMRVKLEKWLGQ